MLNHREQVLIENKLFSPVAGAFLGISDTEKKQKYIREFTIEFCLQNNIPLNKALPYLNHLLPPNEKIEKEMIIPQDEKNQLEIIDSTIFTNINQYDILGNEEKLQEIILNYCKITGIKSTIVSKVIKSKIESLQRTSIEKELYETITKYVKDYNKPESRKKIQEYVLEFSDAIGTTPEYTLEVLSNKFKNEQKKQNIPSSDDNDSR